MSYNKILDQDVKQIKRDIIKIVELTKSQYAKTFEALKTQNLELAQIVIDDDIKINDAQNDFTKMALWKIAKQQMVAGDLRLAVGGILISREIERIADYAKLICRFTIVNNPEPIEIDYISRLFDLVNTMLNIVSSMVENFDQDQQNKVLEVEQQINSTFRELNQTLVDKMLGEKEQSTVQKTISMVRQLKNLERAGDHLINVEEILHFIRKGKFEELNIILPEEV